MLSQLVMNVPFTAIYFSTYESAKKLLNQADREEGLLTQLTAGGVAGAVLLLICCWFYYGCVVSSSCLFLVIPRTFCCVVADRQNLQYLERRCVGSILICCALRHTSRWGGRDAAGGIAAAATTPLDVVKTRLQLEGVQAAARHSSAAVARFGSHQATPLPPQHVQLRGHAAASFDEACG